MITMTCLILWMPAGALAGFRGAFAPEGPATTIVAATPAVSATTRNDLRTT